MEAWSHTNRISSTMLPCHKPSEEAKPPALRPLATVNQMRSRMLTLWFLVIKSALKVAQSHANTTVSCD